MSMMFLALSACKKNEDPVPDSNQHTVDNCIKTGTERFINGSSIETRSYIYNSKNLLIEEKGINTEGKKTDSVQYTYDNNNRLASFYSYQFSTGISQSYKWMYYPDGKVKWDQSSYNGNVSVTNEYFYNDNGKIDSIHSVSSTGTPSYQKYFYSNDTLKKVTRFDGSGNVIRTRNYSYNGNSTTIHVRDAQGNLSYSEEFKKDISGKEIERSQYNELGILLFTRLTEYDGNGNIIRVKEVYPQQVYDQVTTWKCNK